MPVRPSRSNQLKGDSVAIAAASGRSLHAADLGISLSALRRCIRLAGETELNDSGQPDKPVDPLKLKALEARLRELQRQNRLPRQISTFGQKAVEEDFCRVAQENADVSRACEIR